MHEAVLAMNDAQALDDAGEDVLAAQLDLAFSNARARILELSQISHRQSFNRRGGKLHVLLVGLLFPAFLAPAGADGAGVVESSIAGEFSS